MARGYVGCRCVLDKSRPFRRPVCDGCATIAARHDTRVLSVVLGATLVPAVGLSICAWWPSESRFRHSDEVIEYVLFAIFSSLIQLLLSAVALAWAVVWSAERTDVGSQTHDP
jgi:hypothetical protein